MEGIWEDFEDCDVKRIDGTQLKYWNPITASATNTGGLLRTGNGQCGAWAEFLKDSLGTHEIAGATKLQIKVNSMLYPTAMGFLVKKWRFGRHIHVGSNGECESGALGDDKQIVPKGTAVAPNTVCINSWREWQIGFQEERRR